MRLELTRHNCHYPLKVARLPIPPFLQFRVIILLFSSCPEQDSNLHVSQHSHLKRARLPFRHLGKRWSKIFSLERKTRLELATLTLARLCSTNWAISAIFATEVVFSIADAKVRLIFESASVFEDFLSNYFIFFSNCLLIRYSILFSCFVEFRLHGRIFVGEFADSEFLGVI